MNHADHVALLRPGVPAGGGVWADVGAGTGAFTLALAELLGPRAGIVAIDRDGAALAEAERQLAERFPGTRLAAHRHDFTDGLPVEPGSLDGVVMANSLHFVRRKEPVLRAILAAIRPGGRFLLVEYGADRGNPWVPWPLSFATWQRLAESVGLERTHLIGEVPSRFLGSVYAAASDVPG